MAFTYVKVCSSVAHPPNHNIRIHHPTVGRDTESYPSRRADVHCKCNCSLGIVEVPVEHVRISTLIVERGTEGVTAREVMSTQNKGQHTQQTQ